MTTISALARSISRSARCARPAKSPVFGGHLGRCGSQPMRKDLVSAGASGGIGTLRGYLTSWGKVVCGVAGSGAGLCDLDWRLLLGNPNFKKNHDNYYPKDKKDIPKGVGNNKLKGVSDKCGKLYYREEVIKLVQKFGAPVLVVLLLLSAFSYVSNIKIFCPLEDFLHAFIFVDLLALTSLSFAMRDNIELLFIAEHCANR